MINVGCTVVNLDDIETAASTGLDYLELMGKAVTALENEHFAELLRRVKQSVVPIRGMNGYCPAEIVMVGEVSQRDIKKYREYAKKCSYRAAELGVEKVGIGSPASRQIPKGMDVSQALRQMEEFLHVTAEEFAKYRICVCVEALATCYCNFINTTAGAYDIVERMNHPFIRLVIDFYNMDMMGEADIDLSSYLSKLVHVHISDDENDVYKRSYLKKDRTQIHQERLSKLFSIGYEETVSLEIDLPIEPKKLKESIQVIRTAISN